MGIWFVSAHVRPGFSTPSLTLCRYIIRVCAQSIGMCVTHRVQVGLAKYRITHRVLIGYKLGTGWIQGNTQGTGWGRKVQDNTQGRGWGARKQAI